MLYILEDNTIRLTRGDTARFMITINDQSSNSDYSLADDDTLELTIKKNVKDIEPVLNKKVIGTNEIHIKPTDTKSLSFGKYIYDVQLTTSDGDVYTVIEPSTFEIMKEVT